MVPRENQLHVLRRLLFAPLSKEPSLDCLACSEELPVFITDELSGIDVDRLYPHTAGHLDTCQACLAEYETLTAWMNCAI